jgi:hypothetical protein
MLSAADNTFKYDLGSEDADGSQDATVSVFTLDASGSPRHFYTAHPTMAPDIRPAWCRPAAAAAAQCLSTIRLVR